MLLQTDIDLYRARIPCRKDPVCLMCQLEQALSYHLDGMGRNMFRNSAISTMKDQSKV